MASSPTDAAIAVTQGALEGSNVSAVGTMVAMIAAARQFEALFMRELVKSIREATQKSGLLDSGGTDLGTGGGCCRITLHASRPDVGNTLHRAFDTQWLWSACGASDQRLSEGHV